PKYFKQNNPFIQIGLNLLTPETVRQYQKEEQALIAHRIKASRYPLKDLMDAMINDKISLSKHVESLKPEMAKYYKNDKFLNCKNMGEILKLSLKILVKTLNTKI